jgi:dedicator of cytokinesis protein 3
MLNISKRNVSRLSFQLADESHELYVYKCEDPAKLVASTYLKLPCSANDTQYKVPENNSLFHRSSKEMFNIRTLLCK